MATRTGINGNVFVEAIPKKSRQGQGKHTKYSATSRNKAKKRSRGQGRLIHLPLLMLIRIMVILYPSINVI